MTQLQIYHPSGGTLKLRAQQSLPPPPTPLCQQHGQQQVYFCVSCHVFYISYKSFIAILLFFQFNSYGPTWDLPKLSSQTEFGLPPPTTMFPTTKGSDLYIFEVSYHVLYIFYKCFIEMSQLFQINCYSPTMGMPKTQPTD